MSFKALMLLKNREAVIVKADATKTSFKFGGGLYIVTETDVQNVVENGKIRGAQAIYFEGNPCAVGYEEIAEEDKRDKSGEYLNEIVRLNALKQTASGPRIDWGASFAWLAPLKNPVNLVYLLFGAVIVYGLLAPAMGWV